MGEGTGRTTGCRPEGQQARQGSASSRNEATGQASWLKATVNAKSQRHEGPDPPQRPEIAWGFQSWTWHRALSLLIAMGSAAWSWLHEKWWKGWCSLPKARIALVAPPAALDPTQLWERTSPAMWMDS